MKIQLFWDLSVHQRFAHFLNLEKYKTHFILRLLQRLFGIIRPIMSNASHAKLPLEVEKGGFKNLLMP